MDAMMLIVTVVLFAVGGAYVEACARLKGGASRD